jgi:glycosyltransferase involved in cell wall biosynthesis
MSSFVVPTAPDLSTYGGLERIAGVLAMELARMGHSVTLYAAEGSRCPGCRVVEAAPPSPRSELEVDPEVVGCEVIFDHSHTKITRRYTGPARLVWTIHDWQNWPPMGAPRAMVESMVGSSRVVWVSPSRAHAEHLQDIYGVDPVVINHGLPPELYSPRPKDGSLAFLARMQWFKGPMKFIEYCRRWRRRCVMMGDDVMIPRYDLPFAAMVMHRAAREGVEYLGQVPYAEAMERVARASVLVSPLSPRYGEVFGLNLIEAMLSGTPVLTTESVSPEVVPPGTGLRVREGELMDVDPAELERFDPEGVRRIAVERFSSRRMALEYLRAVGEE